MRKEEPMTRPKWLNGSSSFSHKGIHNLVRRKAIAEGIRLGGHFLVGGRIGEQLAGIGKDGFLSGANEAGAAGIHNLGALGGVSQDEQGLAEAGGLFLD